MATHEAVDMMDDKFAIISFGSLPVSNQNISLSFKAFHRLAF